jgi:hypothetical protein
VLFLLDKPYSFSVGLQKERIKEWKDRYRNFCGSIELVHDASCEDPSRLMYTPAIATKYSPFEVHFIDGAPLDLDEYATKANTFANNPNTPSRVNGNNTQERMYTPETPGLLHFVKNASDFDIVSCVYALIPDAIRGDAAQGNGVCLRCPNEDAHSNVDLNDKAFYVIASNTGWYAGCLHATCKSASANDRLWYLDKMCVEYGWTVDDLAPFSPSFQATLSANIEHKNEKAKEHATEAEFWADVERNVPNANQIIDNTSLDDEASMTYACAVIARGTRIQRGPRIHRLHEVTGANKRDLNALVKEQGERYERAQTATIEEDDDSDQGNAGVLMTAPPPPNDLSEATTIYKNWPPKVQRDAIVAILSRVNNKIDERTGLTSPVVYTNDLGEICSVIEKGPKTYIFKHDATSLSNLVLEHIPYKSVNTQTGVVADVIPDKSIVAMLATARDLPFPVIENVSTVPVLDPDGNLQTKKGYIPSIRTFLNVEEGDWLPVSEVITPEELEKAWAILLESIRDFPFSDDFTGNDAEPIKLTETDEDGFPLPNLDRGASSRMNAIAMIVQRFARALIKGPCPAYFIDKAEAGTGAGYLTNVMACPITGETATGIIMAANDDEFRKNITAAIIGGAPYVFVDNIDRKITSTAFAILLTSGRWRDRILGQSVQTDIEVDSTWVLTGNNASFTYELSRRFVPIRLDANVPNPAFERGNKDFKHTDHPQWLKDNRREVVWAACTIAKAWVNAGMVMAQAYRNNGVTIDGETHNLDHMVLNSFDAYVNVMGGIFVTSAQVLNSPYPLQFLANREGFLNDTKDDTREEDEAVQDMFAAFGTKEPFTARDLFLRGTDRLTGKLKDVYPVRGKDDDDTTRKLGNWLGKQVSKRTFKVETKDGTTTIVKLVKGGRGKNLRKYIFLEL